MIKTKHIIFTLILILLLGGCSKAPSTPKDNIDDLFNINLNDNNKIMYSLMAHRLGIYDLEKKQWRALDDTPNLFQYTFPKEDNYFISGHSLENNYVILKYSGDKLEIVHYMEKDEKIFPLVANDGTNYYLIQKYTDTDIVESKIVTFDVNWGAKVLLDNSQRICEGIISGNNLYYTAYEGKNDTYNLYKLNLETNISVLEQSNLISDDIFLYKNSLYVSDGQNIYNNKNTFTKRAFNYFFDDDDILFQVNINKDGDLEYYITDLISMKTLKDKFDIVNFEKKEGSIILYGNGIVNEISLKDGE
ncbi:hypothetical protein [Anaerocolumna xylanovorans]|uniref:DUF5050 domain-containing protein n=1 Tax=Anaerocolumna xylanovorans DSM 12503 TaxID=1121345 RepID=A0A1M7Y6Q7_9FIRM|nr:hypothetical protein [Anaerocolumna xylanovorans]SHO48337.1 hypothetical protein SAMN02745217_01778 [Anaerocolumna xylanovorans DSM 12503]